MPNKAFGFDIDPVYAFSFWAGLMRYQFAAKHALGGLGNLVIRIA